MYDAFSARACQTGITPLPFTIIDPFGSQIKSSLISSYVLVVICTLPLGLLLLLGQTDALGENAP